MEIYKKLEDKINIIFVASITVIIILFWFLVMPLE